MKRTLVGAAGTVAAAAVAGAILLSNGHGPATKPAAEPMTWEETLRASVDASGLTSAQAAELPAADVFGRCKVPMVAGQVPEAFFYWKVRNKVASDMAHEAAEAKRAALIAETTDRLKTLPGMADVSVEYEDGRLVITGGAVAEAKR